MGCMCRAGGMAGGKQWSSVENRTGCKQWRRNVTMVEWNLPEEDCDGAVTKYMHSCPCTS